ncbi:hypothetical protein L596_010402 [Steinernema carpocapsae]|nr:hypothetical protein L596_010402 [Steinernema carpocapsae]
MLHSVWIALLSDMIRRSCFLVMGLLLLFSALVQAARPLDKTTKQTDVIQENDNTNDNNTASTFLSLLTTATGFLTPEAATATTPVLLDSFKVVSTSTTTFQSLTNVSTSSKEVQPVFTSTTGKKTAPEMTSTTMSTTSSDSKSSLLKNKEDTTRMSTFSPITFKLTSQASKLT